MALGVRMCIAKQSYCFLTDIRILFRVFLVDLVLAAFGKDRGWGCQRTFGGKTLLHRDLSRGEVQFVENHVLCKNSFRLN